MCCGSDPGATYSQRQRLELGLSSTFTAPSSHRVCASEAMSVRSAGAAWIMALNSVDIKAFYTEALRKLS